MIAAPAQEAEAPKRETPVGAGATQETSELRTSYPKPSQAQERFTDPRADGIIKGWLCHSGTTRIRQEAPDFSPKWVSRQTACIYELSLKVEARGDNPDIVTITQAAIEAGRLEEAGGPANITPGHDVWEVVQSSIDSLRKYYQKREGAKIGEGLKEGTVTITDAYHRLKSHISVEADADESLNDYEVPAPVLSEAALYGVAGDIVRKIAPETEAHPASLLLQLLAGMGSIIGRGPHFVTGKDRQHCNLFVAIVGDTSRGRKGTSWGWVHHLLEQADPVWTCTRIKGGLQSGEGIIHELKDGEEGVAMDKRLFIMEGELAQALQTMSRSSSTLSATLRNAWDSGFLNNMSKGEPATASNCHISLVGHITRTELRQLLTANDAGNGFANRILWGHSARTRRLPEGGSEVDLSYEGEMLRGIVDKTRGLGAISRTPSARDYWGSIYGELTREDVPGLWGKATSRAEAQVVRLSLLYCLLDITPMSKAHHIQIGAGHLQAAKALWDYCFLSAQWALEDCRFSKDAQRIYEALQDGSKTKTQVQRDLFNNHITTRRLDAAIRELGEQIRVEKKLTGGKPATLLSLAG